MKRVDVERFININKIFIGLGNYKTSIKYPKTQKDDVHAEIEVGELKQLIVLSLYPTFTKMCKEQQINTLLHELIHGRVYLKEARMETAMEEEEERMVNDITTLAEKWIE